MRKLYITIVAAFISVPITAAAIESYEEGITFAGTGRFNVIVRDTGWFEGQLDAAGEPISMRGPSIEIECSPTVPNGYAGPFIPSTHVVLSTDNALRVADMLEDAVDAAEVP